MADNTQNIFEECIETIDADAEIYVSPEEVARAEEEKREKQQKEFYAHAKVKDGVLVRYESDQCCHNGENHPVQSK